MATVGERVAGAIPVLKVEGETVPEVWERAVILCWQEGISIKTEYDRPEDPPSKDCSMVMVMNDPLGEPRIHRAFPGGLEDLEVYLSDIVRRWGLEVARRQVEIYQEIIRGREA